MARGVPTADRYSDEETQRRVEASLRAAFRMGPMPRKTESKDKPARKPKAAKGKA
jgi:hypothetical protein